MGELVELKGFEDSFAPEISTSNLRLVTIMSLKYEQRILTSYSHTRETMKHVFSHVTVIVREHWREHVFSWRCLYLRDGQN